MRAPAHWQRGNGGWLSFILAPLGWLYNVGSQMNQSSATPVKASVPVICIGNVVAGGAGKTPVALDIGRRLAARGIELQYLSRGYGGTETGPRRVEAATDPAVRVGDEPLLLARVAPAWVARDRVAGAAAMIDAGARAIVMDDGLQNAGLVKDLSFCVIDGTYGIGNGRVMPAGPMRESLEDALAKCAAVVVLGDDLAGMEARIRQLSPAMPVLKASLVPKAPAVDLAGKPVHAFAGIGRPEKFFKTVESLACDLQQCIPFPDHYHYLDEDLEKLAAAAKSDDALLLTTEKDFVRLDRRWRESVIPLQVSLTWQDETEVDRLLTPLFAEFS